MGETEKSLLQVLHRSTEGEGGYNATTTGHTDLTPKLAAHIHYTNEGIVSF
jgi:hypothetical protein